MAAFLNLWFFDHLVDKIFTEYYFISYYEFIDIVQFFLIYISTTSLLKLSRGWFQLAKTEEKLALANRKQLEAELKVLKSQINPHFLFNSLNNLYSLALKQDAQTPEVILQLSESMRYIIYECKEDRVSLEKEIAFLKNYIELQRLRSSVETKIEFGVQGNPSNLKVAPLLFIPFIENGFKHGVKGDTNSGFIKIQLEITDQNILLQVKNNKGIVDEVSLEEGKGIGLENVSQRLQLIYPNTHELKVIDGEQDFEIQLRINLA
jgi:LytS/YehU family sensor histidine kinase